MIHVLPGDSLAEAFTKADIAGEVVICREALVVGDISAEPLDAFWNERANFMFLQHAADPIEYRENVAYELERLIGLPADEEVCLWFEYELFCQVNMWFCITLLKGFEGTVQRVCPLNSSPDNVWTGFADHDEKALRQCFDSRTEFTEEDLQIGNDLWHAFAERDADKLLRLSSYRSPAYPFLLEVCNAAAEIETRPAEIVKEIRSEGLAGIDEIFPEFQKRAGVYGFGDVQVERLIEKL
jgi:hypothetical protein